MKWEINLALASQKLRSRLIDMDAHICLPQMKGCESHAIDRMIGEYIIDTQNPDSELSHFFTRLKASALLPENDRIRVSIFEAMTLLATQEDSAQHVSAFLPQHQENKLPRATPTFSQSPGTFFYRPELSDSSRSSINLDHTSMAFLTFAATFLAFILLIFSLNKCRFLHKKQGNLAHSDTSANESSFNNKRR